MDGENGGVAVGLLVNFYLFLEVLCVEVCVKLKSTHM